MNSLSELMKSITSLQDKIKPLNPKSTIYDYFSEIADNNISKALNSSFAPFSHSISNQLSNIVPEKYSIYDYISKNHISDYAAISSISLNMDQSFQKSLSDITASQFLITNSLNDLFKKIDTTPFGFNALNNAIQGLSNSYLRDIVKTHQWENAEVVKEANESIASVTEEYISENKFLTQEDLEKYGISLINNIEQLYLKSKSKSIKAYLWELIQVISVLFSFYINAYTLNDISNKEVVAITKYEIQELENKLIAKIDLEIQKLKKTRIAQTNVNLRKSNSKRAQIKGLLKTGQIVTVIEISHKWLLVTYIDNETKEPKSGFVYKKYFKAI